MTLRNLLLNLAILYVLYTYTACIEWFAQGLLQIINYMQLTTVKAWSSHVTCHVAYRLIKLTVVDLVYLP